MAVAAALALSAVGTPADADSPYDHVVPLVKIGERLPAASFIDQRGMRTSIGDFRGSTVAVAFIYLRCRDSCPVVTSKLEDVASRLGPDGPFRVAEVTIDPEHDTSRAVRAYAGEHRLQAPGFSVFTGVPEAVDDFDRRMGVNAVASDPDTIVHNDRVVVVAPDGTLASVIDGRSWTPADLAAEMRETAGERASLVDRIDLAVGDAAAFCSGIVAGRSGIGDLAASAGVFAAGIALCIWLARRMWAAGAR